MVDLGIVRSTILGLLPETLILRNLIIRIVGFAAFVMQRPFFNSENGKFPSAFTRTGKKYLRAVEIGASLQIPILSEMLYRILKRQALACG